MARFSKSRLGHLAALGAGIMIGVAAVGTAAAASSGSAAKVATHHLALAASAFAPDSLGDTSKDFSNNWDPAELSNSSGRCFNAGLTLPVNATLKSVTVYFEKGTTSMYFEVNRQDLLDHTFSMLVKIRTAVGTSTPVYSSVTKSVPRGKAAVDMGTFAYSAGVCPDSPTGFSGLIVTYTVPVG
jgi:hypothetical protein